jgi:glycosyltransferase involved in cell wall biosynthesis
MDGHKMNKNTEQNISSHFVFVLASRFPTERAYGVTTEYSAQAVVNQGYRSTIVTPFFDLRLPTDNKVDNVGEIIAKLFLNKKYFKFIFLRFNIFLILYAILIRLRYKSKEYVFWTRDVYLSLILAIFSNKIVICEVHRTPTGIQFILLKLLSIKKNVLIAPISNFLEDKILLNKERMIIAPMAVNSSEIKFFNTRPIKRRKNIVYVGNIENGNTRLDLKNLISVTRLMLKTNPDWTFEIIGISINQVEQSGHFVNSPNLKFLGQLPRDQVMKKLKTSTIGIVLYPDLPWFHDSFPIKIVEYSAAGLAIVATDTISHRRILSIKRCLYFEPNSSESLYNAIVKLIKNKPIQIELSSNSKNWSRKLTYENRVGAVINTAMSLKSKRS